MSIEEDILRIRKTIKCYQSGLTNMEEIWGRVFSLSQMGRKLHILLRLVIMDVKDCGHVHTYCTGYGGETMDVFYVRHKNKCEDCNDFIERNKEFKKVKLAVEVLCADMEREALQYSLFDNLKEE